MNNISFLRLLRFSITASIVLTLIVFIFNVGIASAETGTIDITDTKNINYTPGQAAPTGSPNYSRFLFDTVNYNSIDFMAIRLLANTSMRLQSNTTFFTCAPPNTCTGGASYNKYGSGINWYFDPGNSIISSPIELIYETSIFDNTNIWTSTTARADNSAISADLPVCIAFSLGGCVGQINATLTNQSIIYYLGTVFLETSIDYNITYPISGKYSGSITKSGIAQTKILFEEHDGTVDFSELTFNNVSFVLPLLDYGQGLYINATMQNTFNRVLINSTNAGIPTPANTPSVGANGVGVVFDYNTYTPNTFANISWIRDHSIPFGSVDTVVLSPPSGVNVVLATNPASTGSIKSALSEIGNYKVMYNRTGLFGLGTPVTLDSSTATVTNENPSYIIANATVPSGIAFNASYLFGYTPAIQGELNSIKIERIDLQDITYYSTVSLNNTNIVANTEYNISLTISGLGTYKLSLFDISRGFIANTTVRTIEVPIPIQRNITTSYILTDLTTYFKGDNIEISYGIDNTNFTSYPEKYIRIIHSSGTNPETGRVLTTMQEDIINVEITEVSTWFKWFSGVNYVELHAKNSTADILLANTSFTLAFIDSDGYGLEVSPSTLCTGGTVYIKTSSPSSTLLTVDVYQKNSNGNKILYYQTFVNGSNKTRQLKLVFDGEYFFNLYDTSNASRFVKKVVVDKGNCEAVVTPTLTPLTPEKAQTDVTNLLTNSFFWALVLIVGMMIATGVEMRQRQADAMIPMLAVGFLGLSGFTLIGWVPAWITFSIILLLMVIFAWQRSKDMNTAGD